MNSKYYKELGIELKTARERKGLTQEQAADRMGWSRAAIANYEHGRRNIEIDSLFKLCEVYGEDAFEILHKVYKYLYK